MTHFVILITICPFWHCWGALGSDLCWCSCHRICVQCGSQTPCISGLCWSRHHSLRTCSVVSLPHQPMVGEREGVHHQHSHSVKPLTHARASIMAGKCKYQWGSRYIIAIIIVAYFTQNQWLNYCFSEVPLHSKQLITIGISLSLWHVSVCKLRALWLNNGSKACNSYGTHCTAAHNPHS
jgi:hypothetical protein